MGEAEKGALLVEHCNGTTRIMNRSRGKLSFGDGHGQLAKDNGTIKVSYRVVNYDCRAFLAPPNVKHHFGHFKGAGIGMTSRRINTYICLDIYR